MFFIRADANKEIATGHVMRCLSVAVEIRKMGGECVFITSDENATSLIKSHGFETICLHSRWDCLERETLKLISLIREKMTKKLIIDSYYVTEKYLKELGQYTRLVYIDDMNFFKYPVSMIINYNIFHSVFSYPETYKGTGTRLLLGCEFAPLREEFAGVSFQVREPVRKILITTGGSDPYNVAGKLLDRIATENLNEDICFQVVAGKFNSHLEHLSRLARIKRNIVLCHDVESMSALMRDCDLAITAGGFTMYELCACGVPSVCFSYADNQLNGVKGFQKAGLMAYAGDVRNNEEQCLSQILSHIRTYIENPDSRKEISVSMQKLVDGKGASRIAEAILAL